MEGYTEVFTWGGDHFGQLGLGGKTSGKTYASPRFCSFNITIKEISCGEEHSAFISSSGHIYTMGSNTDGRLGIGSRSIKQSPSPCLVEELANTKALKISCGWGHTAVILESGEVYSWGVGEFGALGNGTLENKWSPVLMSINNLAFDISCGSRHTGIIVKERNGKKSLMMCGGGEAGQLGTGRREKEFTPTFVEMPDDVDQVSCGVFHSAVITTKGLLYTMGGNSFGQLGHGNKKSQSRPEKVMHLENMVIKKVRCSNFTAAITDKGQLYIWGSGVFGEYLLPHRLAIRDHIVDVSIGSGFGLAVDINDTVYSWGGNSNGELGLEDYDPRATPQILQALKSKGLKKISCGGSFCIGLGNDILPRSKTPSRKILQESRKNEDTMKHSQDHRKTDESQENIGKTKNEDVEKLSHEIRQTYKSYEEIKKNFESLSEVYEIEKRANQKYTDDMNRELIRYKSEMERCKLQIEQDDHEIHDMSICIDQLKKVNQDMTNELSLYKDELFRMKKFLDESKGYARLEIQELEEYRKKEILELDDKLKQETLKRKHAENELEKANMLIYNYEDTIRNCQGEINDIGSELQQSMMKSEGEKKILQGQLEKCIKDVNELSMKNEILLVEKEKYQSMLKGDLEKFYIENKELRYQVEIFKGQIQQKNTEVSDLMGRLGLASSEKKSLEMSFQEEFEKFSCENLELRRKVDVLSYKVQADGSEYMDKIERLFTDNEKLIKNNEKLAMENEKVIKNNEILATENEKLTVRTRTLAMEAEKLALEVQRFSTETQNLKENLSQVNIELGQMDELKCQYDHIIKENNQLNKKIDYLTNDKEKVSAGLSAEIEELSHEKLELAQKYKNYYIENEKKITILDEEIDKYVKENTDLKKKVENLDEEMERRGKENIELRKRLEMQNNDLENLMKENFDNKKKGENLAVDKDKYYKETLRLGEEVDNWRKEYEMAVAENRNFSAVIQESSQESSSMVAKFTQNLQEKEHFIQKLKYDLECLSKDHFETKKLYESLKQEKAFIVQNLNEDLNEKTNSIKNLQNENHAKDQNLQSLKSLLNEKDKESINLLDQTRYLNSENSQIKKTLNDLTYELERVHKKLSEQELENINTKDKISIWERKWSELQEENTKLNIEITELEGKNRQLFENLEKELAQRAKDYKERTMSILTVPIRSSSPYIRPLTQGIGYSGDTQDKFRNINYNRGYTQLDSSFEKNKTLEDIKGNTAAKLLQTLEDSPKAKYNTKATIRTPTKEDIQTKIALLAQNRNRLETELRQLDEE
ncbi:hypothetical protein SteCoe_5062 [Stentor coeruleus]|uniref:RCC1-like domain-containing protein n=1 Tax=Stentor coeruleus TaxID=5963 RepID=A0A1R2CTA5_9CILI|nr:hypothetical protein SteCoe_5062 [Stentor coeruleus]